MCCLSDGDWALQEKEIWMLGAHLHSDSFLPLKGRAEFITTNAPASSQALTLSPLLPVGKV